MRFVAVALLAWGVHCTQIDPDTPDDALETHSLARKKSGAYKLVFSDEFMKPGRKFGEGQDPKWTAINSYNEGTLDLEGYNANGASTSDGKLHITANLDITVDPSESLHAGAQHVPR